MFYPQRGRGLSPGLIAFDNDGPESHQPLRFPSDTLNLLRNTKADQIRQARINQ